MRKNRKFLEGGTRLRIAGAGHLEIPLLGQGRILVQVACWALADLDSAIWDHGLIPATIIVPLFPKGQRGLAPNGVVNPRSGRQRDRFSRDRDIRQSSSAATRDIGLPTAQQSIASETCFGALQHLPAPTATRTLGLALARLACTLCLLQIHLPLYSAQLGQFSLGT